MPKFIVEASEEVFYWKEVEADNEQHAIEVFKSRARLQNYSRG